MDNRDPQTYAIIGSAIEVHKQLGPGFLETVYQEALMLELGERQIPFLREVDLPIFYKSQPLAARYRADFICFSLIVVELKAIAHLSTVEEAQLINYLKATGLERGLLLNFGAPSLEYKRFARSGEKSAKSADSSLGGPKWK